MKKSLFLLLFLPVLIYNCDHNHKSDCTFAICTDIFKYVVFQLKHSSDSSAVILTDYKVIRVSDNKDLTLPGDVLPINSGYYPLVSDSQLNILRNSIVEIEFQGYVQNAMIIKRRFDVGADCCHVSLVAGEAVSYIQ
jgi:hypothetical protein